MGSNPTPGFVEGFHKPSRLYLDDMVGDPEQELARLIGRIESGERGGSDDDREAGGDRRPSSSGLPSVQCIGWPDHEQYTYAYLLCRYC